MKFVPWFGIRTQKQGQFLTRIPSTTKCNASVWFRSAAQNQVHFLASISNCWCGLPAGCISVATVAPNGWCVQRMLTRAREPFLWPIACCESATEVSENSALGSQIWPQKWEPKRVPFLDPPVLSYNNTAPNLGPENGRRSGAAFGMAWHIFVRPHPWKIAVRKPAKYAWQCVHMQTAWIHATVRAALPHMHTPIRISLASGGCFVEAPTIHGFGRYWRTLCCISPSTGSWSENGLIFGATFCSTPPNF